MPARLNHTIVAARDAHASARFLVDLLGLTRPTTLGQFTLVAVGDQLSLFYMNVGGKIVSQHYAFLVSEREFDEIFDRIKLHGLRYWADPQHAEVGAINRWDDGRGLYVDDPDGHALEVLTRPYGSGGAKVEHPHPLTSGS